jgi:PEP-CTERM motif
MNEDMLMKIMRVLLCAAVAVTLCSSALAATILINPTTLNGSFEDAPTTKTPNWSNVNAWENWGASVGGPSTASNDSGTDTSAAATNGTHVAFLQPNNAAYNLTSYVAQVGDVFNYTWDWALVGRGLATAQLAYQDGSGNIVAIAGTDTSFQSNTMQGLGLGTAYTALSGDPAIGRPIAITVRTVGNYPEVDNFVLSVTSVPEPGTLAMFCIAFGGALTAGRRRGEK